MNLYSPALHQAEIFFTAVALGVLVGMVLDFYRSMRNIYTPAKIITLVIDFFLWAILTLVIVSVVLFRLRGEVYLFTYLGLVTGYCCYLYTISKYVLYFFNSILQFLVRICSKSMALAKRVNYAMSRSLNKNLKGFF